MKTVPSGGRGLESSKPPRWLPIHVPGGRRLNLFPRQLANASAPRRTQTRHSLR